MIWQLAMAALAATPAPAPPGFACSVEGAKHAMLSPEAICDRVRQEIEHALGLRLAPATAAGDSIRVALRLTRQGVATAQLTVRVRGRAHSPPAPSVAVSDRPLGIGDIAGLAREIARTLRTWY